MSCSPPDRPLLFLALACLLGWSSVQAETDSPVVLLEGARLTRVGAVPELVTPVGMTRLADGSLLVIESHTHQRRADYEGPAGDRVRRLVDSDGDGVPDAWAPDFADGFRHAMNVLARPDGAVYLVTRADVRLLVDEDGDGRSDAERPVLRLDTDEDYPHNALGGIWLEGERLFVGLGENFGARYTLVGTDGSAYSDAGGCGRIFVCGPDGADLRPYASGLWNPFALYGANGRLYCIDNDPDARPPCRLLEVQHGDDFGYRYEYHRAGLHPLQAWNGELPGTKGMVAGVGEAPTGMVLHRGWLYVTSWGEHRIERYRLGFADGVVRGEREVVVQGLADFRPTGLAIGADGALWFGDWVRRDYPVHGSGRLWRLELPDEDERPEPPAGVAHSLAERLAGEGGVDEALLDLRVAREARTLTDEQLVAALRSDDRVLRLCAVRYAADERRSAVVGELERLLAAGPRDSQEALALLAASEWLNPARRKATSTAALVARHVDAASLPAGLRALALRATPVDDDALAPSRLSAWLDAEDEDLRREAAWSLALRPGDEARAARERLATDPDRAPELRAIAVVGLSAEASANEALLLRLAQDDESMVAAEAERGLRLSGRLPRVEEERPAADDLAGWLDRLEEGGDAASGERLFFHPTGPGCSACHVHDGRGARVGPDLSRLGSAQDRRRIATSILRPDQDVAPRYEPWILRTRDGALHTGFLLPRGGDQGRETYIGSDGTRFTLAADAIESRVISRLSIMPSGLESALSVEDLQDLLAFLAR